MSARSTWTVICVQCGKSLGIKEAQNRGGWCARCEKQRRAQKAEVALGPRAEEEEEEEEDERGR